MTSVAVIGGVSYNLMIYLNQLPEPRPGTIFSQGYHETVGETGAGKALALHRLGLDVTLHALLGNDVQGQAVRDYFAREGLSCIFEYDPRGTSRHVNLMSRTGGRVSIYIERGTLEPSIDRVQLERIIVDSDYVVLNIINYCRHLIPLVHKHHKLIWCDIHDYDGHNPYHQDFIDNADYLFMSSDSIRDYRSFMEEQIRRGKKLVVCTHGNSGATALADNGEWIETPALTSYPVIDTNGAGDNFFSGVLYGYIHAYPLATCLRLGTLMGALSVTAQELVPPDLTAALLEKEYARHYRML